MDLYRLALKNIAGSAFRSWVVALSALLVASLALGTTLIMRGAQNSLRLAIDRLGADVIVVPEGTATEVETALLMGIPTEVWMPREVLRADLERERADSTAWVSLVGQVFSKAVPHVQLQRGTIWPMRPSS